MTVDHIEVVELAIGAFCREGGGTQCLERGKRILDEKQLVTHVPTRLLTAVVPSEGILGRGPIGALVRRTNQRWLNVSQFAA